MKGYSKKMLVGVSFASLMLGSFQGVSLAEDTKGEQVSYRNVLKMEPVGVQLPVQELAHSSKLLESKSFEQRIQFADLSQRPPEVKKESKQLAVAKTYTIAELNQLSNQQLVDLLITIDWSKLRAISV
ncbi:hypothetical protein HFP64_04825 [Bacillus sp. AC79A.1]